MSATSHFDCFPSDFLNGVIGLTADQIAAYTIILMLQYDNGGPIEFRGREREIAVRSGMSKGRLAKAVSELADLGKLRYEDGLVWNGRTERELEKIREKLAKNRENSEKGGNATRAKFAQIIKENNDAVGPSGQPIGQPEHGPISTFPLPSSQGVTDPNGSVVVGQADDLAEQREKRKERTELCQNVVAMWNGMASECGLATVRDITSGRQAAIVSRAEDLVQIYDYPEPLAGFADLFARIRGSQFCQGKNRNEWRADFDFAVKKQSFTGTMEGKYETGQARVARRT